MTKVFSSAQTQNLKQKHQNVHALKWKTHSKLKSQRNLSLNHDYNYLTISIKYHGFTQTETVSEENLLILPMSIQDVWCKAGGSSGFTIAW